MNERRGVVIHQDGSVTLANGRTSEPFDLDKHLREGWEIEREIRIGTGTSALLVLAKSPIKHSEATTRTEAATITRGQFIDATETN